VWQGWVTTERSKKNAGVLENQEKVLAVLKRKRNNYSGENGWEGIAK